MSVFALDCKIPTGPPLSAGTDGSLIPGVVHQRTNKDSPHRAEWCHAPAMCGTALFPDAGSLPLRSGGASQSIGSQERSADMQHHAPLLAAE